MSALIKKYFFLLLLMSSAVSCFLSASVLASTAADSTSSRTFQNNSPVFVFIDAKLDDYQTLVRDIQSHNANQNIAIVYLTPDHDGLQQITDALANQTGVTAIHVLTHGMPSSIQLGSVALNQNTIDVHREKLMAWRKSLTANADILIYGCNVTATDEGVQLIKKIGDLTHAHIAASKNATGAVALDGDWNLESHYGDIKTNVIISVQAQKSWNSTLGYTDYISINPGTSNSQSFRDNANVGSSFNGVTATVNAVAVQLKKGAGAATQSITACIRLAWNSSASEKCASMSSDSLTTSFQWYVFNFGNFNVTSGTTYYIQIWSLGTDSQVFVNYSQSSLWNSNTTFYYNNTTNSSWDMYFVLSSGSNDAPTVANAIPDQTASESSAFSYQFASNTFSDSNSRDTLTYSATLSSNAALPAWLSFNTSTRTFSGTPGSGDVGTISVKVTANDGNGGTVSDTFDIVVSSNLHHYGISLTSPGVTCAGSAITITAYNSGGTAVAPANGTVITLSTSPATGSWVGGNTATFDGVVTSKTKYLQQTTASTLNINVTDGTHSESVSLDPNIVFDAATLAFYGSTGLGSMPNQIAGTADNNPILKAANCTSQVSGAQNVQFGYECRNPTTCVAGQTLTVNGNSVQSNANGASISYSAAQSLTFNGSGIASIPINYSDVGKVKIYASLAIAASGNNPAITLTANSGDFIVKPHTLIATAIQTAGAVANPGGSSVAGSGAQFVSAGTAFTVKVEVRNSAGNRTPNFGNETTTENNLKFVEQSLVYPSGGTLTALTNPSAFSATTPAGTFINSTIYWNQVGSFTARPELADNDYQGAGDVTTKTTSGTIGRFYPDHFALASSSTANSCSAGGFSFMDQPGISFNYVLQAQSATNAVVTNYAGNYSTATVSYVAENNNSADGASFTSARLGAPPAWSSGAVTVASTTTSFARQTSTAPDGPYASLQYGLVTTDTFDSRSISSLDMNALTTGVCSPCTAKAIGSSLNMRYGRLRLDSASGPETVKLPVNFLSEYWSGNGFILNANDSCTVVPRAAITYTPSLGGGGTLSTDANRTSALSLGSTTGMYSSLDGTGVHFVAGNAGHYFSAPTAAGTGSVVVGIDLTNLAWLRSDWNQNGNYSTDTALPNATFKFGTYRGNDRIIYWHERF